MFSVGGRKSDWEKGRRILLNLLANLWFNRDFIRHDWGDFFLLKNFYFDKILVFGDTFFNNFLLHFEDETLSKKTKGILLDTRERKR